MLLHCLRIPFKVNCSEISWVADEHHREWLGKDNPFLAGHEGSHWPWYCKELQLQTNYSSSMACTVLCLIRVAGSTPEVEACSSAVKYMLDYALPYQLGGLLHLLRELLIPHGANRKHLYL